MAFRTILVPLDGSPPSIAALGRALALAQDSGGRIDVLHVEAPNRFEVGSSVPATQAAEQDAGRRMNDAIEAATSLLGDRLSCRTVSGDPLRKIVEVAGEAPYDVVVIGTHGRVGRLHGILGSVAEAVVRNAPCPVLTIREPGGEDQSFSERLHRRPTVAEQVARRPPS